MDERTVAMALSKAGYSVHLRADVWWQKVAPFYCKPVDPLRVLLPRASVPDLRHSLIGYSHLVPDQHHSTRTWSIMLLPPERLRNFSIELLKTGRRTSVRKALKQVEIRRIDAIAPVLDRMNEISISTAQRTGHGLPPEYYTKSRREWAGFMLREYSIPDREWWGVYVDNELVGYFYAYLIGSTMYISATKSHSDYMKLRPNDAWVFSFVEYCRNLPGCDQVVYGDWSPDAPTLNEFKEQFGFEKRDLPVYRHERLSFALLSKLARFTRGGNSIRRITRAFVGSRLGLVEEANSTPMSSHGCRSYDQGNDL
jgi:hypothetical protein